MFDTALRCGQKQKCFTTFVQLSSLNRDGVHRPWPLCTYQLVVDMHKKNMYSRSLIIIGGDIYWMRTRVNIATHFVLYFMKNPAIPMKTVMAFVNMQIVGTLFEFAYIILHYIRGRSTRWIGHENNNKHFIGRLCMVHCASWYHDLLWFDRTEYKKLHTHVVKLPVHYAVRHILCSLFFFFWVDDTKYFFHWKYEYSLW